MTAMVVGDKKGMNGVNGTGGGAGDEEGLEFETTRIEVLKEERSQIQKKTFTKWVNSNLKKKKVIRNVSLFSFFPFLFSNSSFSFFLLSFLFVFCFLVACTRLYKSLCLSVGRLVGHTFTFLRFWTFQHRKAWDWVNYDV